ncbi:hypothetical protein BSKO_00621 [Bryopsis sp. KO-2023]|nr:hypothetical protein BSKO_00621 [Bryopsis sp. KO-2023]
MIATLLLLALSLRGTESVPDGFIRAKGLKFVDKDCKEFMYSGWNSGELLDSAAGSKRSALRPGEDTSHWGDMTEVEWLMSESVKAGMTVGRIFGHGQSNDSLVLQAGPGSYFDKALEALDTVIAEAADAGVKLIITFGDNWRSSDSKAVYAGWAGVDVEDFFTNKWIRKLYKDHIVFMLNRVNSVTGVKYKDDPTIFAWNIMNEPRCACSVKRDPTSKSCDPACGDDLQAWIEDMAEHIKSHSPIQMLTVGEEGFYRKGPNVVNNPDKQGNPGSGEEKFLPNGWPDLLDEWAFRQGQDFYENHAMPTIDYGAMHMWPDNWAALDISFQELWIKIHVDDAIRMDKPVTLQEFGKEASQDTPPSRSIERDPFFRSAFDQFAKLRKDTPLKGIGFWLFDTRNGRPAEPLDVRTDHSTFTDIISPEGNKLLEELETLPEVEDCMPGETRSYDTVSVDGEVFITSGRHLVAQDEGESVGEAKAGVTEEECGKACLDEEKCSSFAYMPKEKACQLQTGKVGNVAWSPDGWQTYWLHDEESKKPAGTTG